MKNAILLAAALTLAPVTALADVIKCTSLEFAPLIFVGSDKKPTGLAVDVVQQVLKKMGHTLEVEIYPWARSLEMVKRGERDCIFTAYKTPEREEFLDFSKEVLIPQVISFYAKKGSSVKFTGDLESIKGQSVGVTNAISYGPKFDAAKGKLKVDTVQTLDQNFQKLAMGRVDLVPSNLYTASFVLGGTSKSLAKDIVEVAPPIETVSSYIGFSKKKSHAALRDKFDVELKKFFASGEFEPLLKKYEIPVESLRGFLGKK